MIRRLDETTVGQIAAGEVIERPLSVVKELVENALDAGATRVAVAVVRGGVEAIEVTDDGAGIAPAELPLAFARHATSKLQDASDLLRVRTLGFRGEGLASIAAVAHVKLVSRTPDSEIGYAVDAFESAVSAAEPLAAAPGTRVLVRDLFANVPVRREYLRSASAEFSRIGAFLGTLALAYPHVRFSLAHDGRQAWVLPADPALEQRLAHVFGAPARELLAFEGDGVRGFASRPGTDRGDRRMQLLFVNGRLLRSQIVSGAWSAAYASYALVNRYPYGVLFLDVAPEDVDPNVHPTKSDVRLRRPTEVLERTRRALGNALAADARARMARTFSLAPPLDAAAANGAGSPHGAAPELASFAFVEQMREEEAALRVLAQLDRTYILATDGDALVLVDQHAAHERIAYESIARAAESGGACEPLLVPYAVELDGEQAARLDGVRETLASSGLEIEPFGERTYRITATPGGYGARAFDVRGLLQDVLDEIPDLDSRERVWASLACHSVVRAGDALEYAEMAALIARLVRCRNPMHCPHGRPTMVRIEAAEVARLFKRT